MNPKGRREATVRMRDYSDILYSNKEVIQMLISDASRGTLSHAYIIEGDEGSGKKTLAKLTAMTLACRDADGACLECETCVRIRGDMCPDIFFKTAEPGRKTIGVETVRKIKEESYITPSELDFKMFVIDSAQTLTNEAQNALLKLLEEPPLNVFFFLLCDSVSSVLPTVRSRAPVLRMQVFSSDELEKYILSHSEKAVRMKKTSCEDFDLNIRAARGSIGRLKKLFEESADPRSSQMYKTVSDLFGMLCEGKKTEFLLYCTALPENREMLDDIYANVQTAVRDMLCSKLSDNAEILFFSSRDDAYVFAEKFTAAELLRLSEICDELRYELSSNVNLSSSKAKFALEFSDNK